VTLHLWQPGRPAQTLVREVPLALDLDGLRTLLLDNDDYARALTSMIFAPPALMHGWRKALDELQHISPIRLRFAYSPESDDLHAIRWELLQHTLSRLPEPLALSGRFLCSRYLEGSRYDPLPQNPLHELSALVIVASPRGLEHYGLAPLDSQREVDLVRQALSGRH